MNVYPLSNLNVKGNYYKVSKYGNRSSVYIMTDNAEKLGSKPICETKYSQDRMLYDGKYFVSESPIPTEEYKIRYSDTGKYENNGKEKFFIYEKLKALVQRLNLQPEHFVLSKGATQGKLIHAKNIDEKLLNSKTPLIIICEDENDCYKYFQKANGMILKSAPAELLSHFSALCRNYFSFGSLLTNKTTLKNLESLENKNIYISNKNGKLTYKEKPSTNEKFPVNKKIELPELKRIDKILSLEECEKDNVGNKAYNLKRMTNLLKEGKLQNINIPKAFVLPYAYLERIEKSISENPQNVWFRKEKNLTEIKNYAKGIITQNEIMVRSAFNGEDLENYSAAGLYQSQYDSLNDMTLNTIYQVMQSKNNSIATRSREKYGIKDEEIKPSIIIQDYINSDYSFTTYTESPTNNNTLLIELFINKDRHCKPDPYQITYDKNSAKFTIEQEHSMQTEYIFDENYQLVEKKVVEKSNLDNLWNILETLVKNALVLEKEFGNPQDIEGGIKNGQLYFWQTRNIIKKIHP